MITTCLDDYIGFEGCTTGTPESGVFINELYGIGLENVDKIADKEQVTYSGVWDDVQKRVLLKLHSLIQTEFSRKYRLKRISKSVDLGQAIDTSSNQTAQSAQLRGFTVELHSGSIVPTPNSSLNVIHFQSIRLYSKAVESGVAIKVIDMDTLLTLETFTKDLVIGWNTIATNKDYTAMRVFVGYDASGIESPETELNSYVNDWCNCVCDDFFGYDCDAQISGAYSALTYAGTTKGENTYGLTAVINVQCKFDAFVCQNKTLFIMPLLYLLGMEMMNERIYSDRLNRIVTVDRNKAIELRNEYKAEFEREMLALVESVDLKMDCCLECDELITSRESMM